MSWVRVQILVSWWRQIIIALLFNSLLFPGDKGRIFFLHTLSAWISVTAQQSRNHYCHLTDEETGAQGS